MKKKILFGTSFVSLFCLLSFTLITNYASAAIQEVTNNEKLSLATSTPVGTKVKVTDIFATNGAGQSLVNGIWTSNGNSHNGKSVYIHNDWFMVWQNVSANPPFVDGGWEWAITNTIDNAGIYYSHEDVADPWLVETWNRRGVLGGFSPAPMVINQPTQQLMAPSGGLTAVFVSDAGSQEANGIYVENGTVYDKPSYHLLGSTVDGSLSNIEWNDQGGDPPSSWRIYNNTDGDTLYKSEEDVAYPWLVSTWVAQTGSSPLPTTSSVTQGELDAGVTVSGAGESSANGVRVAIKELANGRDGEYGFIPYSIFGSSSLGISVAVPAENNFWVITSNVGSYITSNLPAFPWQTFFTPDDGTPPPPTVTRNDIAAEANWQIYEDTEAPTISNLSITTSQTGATITFETDEDATSTLQYGLTTSYGTTQTETEEDTTHSYTLTSLTAETTYHYKITVSDPFGNIRVSSDATFTTTEEDKPPVKKSGGGGGSSNSDSNTNTPNEVTNPILPTDCQGGELYASSNGAKCPLIQVQPEGCQIGFAYSPLTGERCITPGSTSSPQAGSGPSAYLFTRNLTIGSEGEDVRQLQIYLNTHGFILTPQIPGGSGSPGHETTYFGNVTQSALVRFQAANGINPPQGYFGPITRSYISLHP